MTRAGPAPAVFLDRDGTLNLERGYITRPDQLVLLPGVAEAVRALHAAGFLLPVVTQQSGIARGIYTEPDLALVHDALRQELPELATIYHCPHHPEGSVPAYTRVCSCRKPAPGMLERATAELGIDLSRSFLVGDSARDLLMSRGLGLRTVLVRTGRPTHDPDQQLAELRHAGLAADHVADDLAGAARWILLQGR
jgi:D,D-heptose 1,7-bisphosphate phosphatase